jgi:hypothetical protein
MSTSALLLTLAVLLPLTLSFYLQRFGRERTSQHAAVLSSLGIDNAHDTRGKNKKKFIGFFHPYW